MGEKKKMMIEDSTEPRQSQFEKRTSIINVFTWKVKHQISKRKLINIIYENVNVTPKSLLNKKNLSRFNSLGTLHKKDLWKPAPKKIEGGLSKGRSNIEFFALQSTMQTSIEDIFTKLSINVVSFDDVPYWRVGDETAIKVAEVKQTPYIKITLKETDDIQLFNKASITTPKGSDEAKIVEDDNKNYDYLTIGKGKVRRKVEAEAQTIDVLYKSRDANTDTIKVFNIGSYVSNFEMFDTYKQLEKSITSIDIGGQQLLEITTYKHDENEEYNKIFNSTNFKLAIMMTQRVLAGNNYYHKQRRFRNMYLPDPLALDIKYSYTLDTLWILPKQCKERRAVNAMCWCPGNGDILAVSYGPYAFAPVKNDTIGFICIWSIKNPVNPERRYEFPFPVISLEFSQFLPQLLAIGLYDGSVEVRDISNVSGPPIARSEKMKSSCFEAITQIRWIELGAGEMLETEPFLASSQDGNITKYRLTNSPYLIGFQLMQLDRVEGQPEGLPIIVKESTIQANRHPQALNLTIHPIKKDIYYVLTDEGCIHKCSVNYLHQHIELLKAHNGCIYSMEFSPWSPKLFLTCGSDFCIRIWLDGILTPLLKLSSGLLPVHSASWSPTHSTIIVGVTRKNIEIWDIKKNVLQPVTAKNFGKAYLTFAKFSNCGRSIVVGNEKGKVFMNAFENMPFPAHYQYQDLEDAILKSLMAFPELKKEVKSYGYWGYSTK